LTRSRAEVGTKQEWQDAFVGYKELIRDPHHDSEFLRRTGLVPHIVDLIGDVDAAHVLDAGCGTGWLFDTIAPRLGHECDSSSPRRAVNATSARSARTSAH
jgi:2-polyprenyl-3-methyl-5-hydroxy-6-metoxy-1,4-benzoquinol methylase